MTRHDSAHRGPHGPADGATSSQAGVLERSGSLIHYWLAGPEQAPLVDFTPGATMDHRMFDSQMSVVVGAGYRFLAWDPRGHGLSKPIGCDFSVRDSSEDLLAILDHLGVQEVALVGQSLGGNAAQELVFCHPERIRALAVIGCTCNTILPSRLGLLTLKLSPLAFRLWPYGDLRRRMAKAVSSKPEVQEYARDTLRRVSREEFLTRLFVQGVRRGFPDSYRIEHPLLITHGEKDRLGNIARIAPTWTARDPNSRYVVIPGAGHNADQDDPTFFNRLLLDFLRGNFPPAESRSET